VEQDGAENYVFQLAVPDALDQEQIDANRRRDLPELDMEHDAEHLQADADIYPPILRGKTI
jgi:hypothetical protein